MTVALILGGLVLLSFPAWLDQRHAFGPARFARIARASMTLGFVGVVLGFVLWGVPAVLHWADAVGVPGLCDDAVHRLPLGGLELAVPMAAIALAVSGRAFAAARRARRNAGLARVDPYFGHHRRVGRYDVVVIPSPQLVAVGVPGEDPQIVLSEGLVAELSTAELDAVLRHEVAHHQLHHRHYVVTAAVIDQVLGWLPPIRTSAARVCATPSRSGRTSRALARRRCASRGFAARSNVSRPSRRRRPTVARSNDESPR